jgi:hypothetical protein
MQYPVNNFSLLLPSLAPLRSQSDYSDISSLTSLTEPDPYRNHLTPAAEH